MTRGKGERSAGGIDSFSPIESTVAIAAPSVSRCLTHFTIHCYN